MAGLRLEGQGRGADARRQYEQVLALDAQHPDALHLLALLDLADGNASAALDKVDRAIASFPGHAALHDSKARILRALDRTAALETPASVSNPDADALMDTAADLRNRGRPGDAERLLGTVLAARPGDARALAALGQVLRDMLRYSEAAAVYERLIASGAGEEDQYVALLADCLVQVGRADEARSLAAGRLQRSPAALPVALRAKLSLKPVYDDLGDLERCRDAYAAGLADLWTRRDGFLPAPDSLIWSNFYLAYQGGNDLALQSAYSDFAGYLLDRTLPHLREPIPRSTVKDRRIRIGFASHYFYECSAGRYFRTWIQGLERETFEVFVYHVRAGLDALGESIRDSVDHFRRPTADRFWGDAIRADELDVLVYPELGGNGLTFMLAALRLAPLQCAGWGHPVTTGHSTIDCFFSSDLMEPSDGATHYRERLVRLPGLGTDYAPPQWQQPVSMSQARQSLGLPLDRRLYLFPQSIYKIHPDNDDLLASVLAEDPRGTLVVFPGHTSETTEQYLRRLAAVLKARGLDIHERVLILPIMSRQTYMQVNAACDVMLDSLHWSGGNTSLDAFAAALPVVTLPGRFMRGRQTLGMLRTMGLDELVAADEQSYVHLALEIANGTKTRRELAERIGSARSKLFGDTSAIAAMRAFYLDEPG